MKDDFRKSVRQRSPLDQHPHVRNRYGKNHFLEEPQLTAQGSAFVPDKNVVKTPFIEEPVSRNGRCAFVPDKNDAKTSFIEEKKMRRRTSLLLCFALALELALSGLGADTGLPLPATAIYAEEGAGLDGTNEEHAVTVENEDASAAGQAVQAEGAVQEEADTGSPEGASAEGAEESVSDKPAAASEEGGTEDAEEASSKDGADQEESSQDGADQEESSKDGASESGSADGSSESDNTDDSSESSSTDDSSESSSQEDASENDGTDDSKVSSYTVVNWRNCTELEGAVKSVKLDGKDITDAEAPHASGSASKTSSGTSSTSSGKKNTSAMPMTFKAGQTVSVEIRLNKGFVFDNTAGEGWSVWWTYKDESGDYMIVSGSLEAAADDDAPLLLKGTIDLPPADKTKYAYHLPEEVTFDNLTLTFDARKVTDSLELTVAAPVCGTKITVDEDTGEQDNAPAVSLPKGSHCEVVWNEYVEYTDDEDALYYPSFEGTIQGGTTYYAFISLCPTSELYGFSTSKEMAGLLEKEGSDGKVIFSSPLMLSLIVPVTAEHADTEEVVTKNVKATCTAAGVKTTETRCKGCGTVLDAKEVKTDATGHDWSEWVTSKEPTATQAGQRTRTCKNDASHVQTQEIPATGETVTYTFTKGANTTWTKSTTTTANLEFTVKRSADDDRTYSLFDSIMIDGKAVDSGNYTTASGSLKLTLKNAYLKTLSAATHTLTVKFQDGSVSTKFTVKAATAAASTTKSSTTTSSSSPRTGDENYPVLWAAIAAGALAAILILTVVRRKARG